MRSRDVSRDEERAGNFDPSAIRRETAQKNLSGHLQGLGNFFLSIEFLFFAALLTATAQVDFYFLPISFLIGGPLIYLCGELIRKRIRRRRSWRRR